MTTFFIAVIIFLDILYYLVIIDVILSWLSLAGISFRPQFIRSILDPIYLCIGKYIPTKIGMFELTPIIVLLLILFTQGVIFNIFPEVSIQVQQIISK